VSIDVHEHLKNGYHSPLLRTSTLYLGNAVQPRPGRDIDARKTPIDRSQKAKVKNEKLSTKNQGIAVKSRVRKKENML
jgi:hypothetical protein